MISLLPFLSHRDTSAFDIIFISARYLSRLLGHFWSRWSNEYLLNLREFHHLKGKNLGRAEVQEGDVVVVKETDAPRSSWKLAVVEKLIPSKDDEIRGATIRVVNGKGKLTRLNRPLKVLFPLEVSQKEDKKDKVRRPRREAAMNADAIRRAVDQLDN